MRKLIVTSLLALAAAPVFAQPYFAHTGPSINERQARQDHRINQGIRSGRITPQEAQALHHQQARIQRMEYRARADGHVDPQERARLNHALDRQSDHIRYQMRDADQAHVHHGYRW